MAITTIDGFSFDTLDAIKAYKNGILIAQIEEPTDAKIEFTGDTKESKGANGGRIKSTTINRGVKISGSNGVISGGMIAMTFNATESNTDVVIKYHASVTVTAAQVTAHTITLSKAPYGTVGAEINVLHVTTTAGVVTELTQATTAAIGKFSLSGSAITFNTGAIAAGDVVTCDYDTKLTDGVGTKIVNDLKETSTPVVDVIVEGMGSSVCDSEKQSYYQFKGFQMQANMNWSMDISDSQTKQPFEFSSSVSKCRKDSIGSELIVYDEEDQT